jgi:hypothetical protein
MAPAITVINNRAEAILEVIQKVRTLSPQTQI